MINNDKTYVHASIVKVVGICQEENMLIVQYMNGNKCGLIVLGEEVSNYKELDVLALINDPNSNNILGIVKIDISWWSSFVSIGYVNYITNEEIIVSANGGLFALDKSDLDIHIGDLVKYDSLEQTIVQVIPKDRLTSDEKNEYLVDVQKLDLAFNDFGGYPVIVKRARELIETQLKERDKLREIGAKPVKGVLFTGLPGTGKTHLARIIAKESGANFYHIDGPSIVKLIQLLGKWGSVGGW